MKFKRKPKLKVERINTWTTALEDKPGNLAAKLDALAIAGVNLELVIARRAPDRPGMGVLFVSPINGTAKVRAAQDAGFQKTTTLQAIKVEGQDELGEGARICRALAEKGINMRGLSAAACESKFVAYIAFDNLADAALAESTLREL